MKIKYKLNRVGAALGWAAVAATISAASIVLAVPAQAQGPRSRVADTGAKRSNGDIEVVVRLTDAPLARAQGDNAKRRGMALTRTEARAHLANLNAKQQAAADQIRALGGREVTRLSRALNAVVVKIPASQVATVAALPGVASVRPVRDYRLDLSETVPYIGAAAAQAAGKDGTGVTVAVLDSGIDYTHRNLGGSGSLADFAAADAARDTAYPGFPTAKVIGGFDFVGNGWPDTDRTEDPNPIDSGPEAGHGTHVADIIAGKSVVGPPHVGVAPGASLLAVKVCSSVSTSCNGVALLKGVDFALDPNGDGDLSDAADVINMSLGSSYGQKEDDLSEASANAVRLGVVVVVSAGNSADRPYIVGSPSTTPEVISVAQTQVPSATTFALRVNSPASIAGSYSNTSTVDWAPIGTGFTANIQSVPNVGCAASDFAGFVAGSVALINRGSCNISLKTKNASDAGAIGVLVALVAPGDAVSFSNGGDCPAPPNGTCKPTLIVTQAIGNLLRSVTGPVNVTVDTSTQIPLIGGVVGSSSRGPSYSYNAVKPDIGAPGASVSAIYGTGTGEEAFGGTSGAAPMVSGSAAILLQAFPDRSPIEIKSLLMNTAETNIQTNPATQPGVLAPITRIGGGEVRVDRALASTLAAWDSDDPGVSLSFGYLAASDDKTLTRSVTVHNYSNVTRRLSISPSFRYADDAASRAVKLNAPSSVTVRAHDEATFKVRAQIDASKLPTWTLNGGSQGGNGPLLQSVEFDGYITLSDSAGSIHLPWQVLPHKAASIDVSKDEVRVGQTVKLANDGVLDGRVEIFAMTGKSKKIHKNQLPQPGDNFAVIDLRAVGVRVVGSNLQFAFATNGERAHPNYPAEFDVYVDTNGDGQPDYVVYNTELNGFGATGQNVVYVVNLAAGTQAAYFYADADLDSSNMTVTAPLAALGLTSTSSITFDVYAFDNYFTGNLTDAIEGMQYSLGTPRYTYTTTIPVTGVPAGGSSTLKVQRVPGGAAASPSQRGFLMLFRDSASKNEAAMLDVDD